jgi:hypothetical protein
MNYEVVFLKCVLHLVLSSNAYLNLSVFVLTEKKNVFQ